MLLLECDAALERSRQADLVQLIAAAYGGCRTKEGSRAMRELVRALQTRE